LDKTIIKNTYQILDWDSNFFRHKFAKIFPQILKINELVEILSEMKEQNIRIAYWASDPGDEESQEGAKRFGGVFS
jgi:hypothetical protein